MAEDATVPLNVTRPVCAPELNEPNELLLLPGIDRVI